MLAEDNIEEKPDTHISNRSSFPILDDPKLSEAFDLVTKAKSAEPKIWNCLDDDCNKVALSLYDESISVFPDQVMSYFHKAMLLLRTASEESQLSEVKSLLRIASKNLPKYRRITPPWNEQTLCKTELTCGKQAEQKLALLLIQENTEESIKEGKALLQSMGYSHMLDANILCNNCNVVSSDESKRVLDTHCFCDAVTGNEIFLKLVDDALPQPLLEALQTGFNPKSDFWRVHKYGEIGFFSYLYYLDQPPRNNIEQSIQYLFQHAKSSYPLAHEARVAEYWVHSRPLGYGHQLHFDSDDEGRGGIRHPILGSILFVDGGDQTGCTVITNQVLKGPMADKGFLIAPNVNRYFLFNGDYLHGVMPGKSVLSNRNSRRVTFMCAFWRDIECRPRPDCETHPYGSAMNLDPVLDEPWMKMFPKKTVSDNLTSFNNSTEHNVDETVDASEMSDNGSSSDSSSLLEEVQRVWGTSNSTITAPAYMPNVWQAVSDDVENVLDVPSYEKCFQGM